MFEPVFSPEQIKLLDTPLRPDEIEHKQGMSYLKGQLAVIKANRIFGLGNWAYKQIGPIEITDTGVDNSRGNRIYLVSATVELTVRGCETFVEQGDCEAQGMGAPAISMARKGAVTDGLKRCLKNFGAAFGLELYFTTPPPPPGATEQRQQTPHAAAKPVNAYPKVNTMPHASSSPQNASRPPVTVTPAQPIPASNVATLVKASCPEHGDKMIKPRMVTGEDGVARRMNCCLEPFCDYMVAV